MWILIGFGLLWFIPLMAHGKVWANTIAAVAAFLQLASILMPTFFVLAKRREWGWVEKVFLTWAAIVAFLILLFGLQSGNPPATTDDFYRNKPAKKQDEKE